VFETECSGAQELSEAEGSRMEDITQRSLRSTVPGKGKVSLCSTKYHL